jgi:aspartate carbamoyltransferase regulatory subunit
MDDNLLNLNNFIIKILYNNNYFNESEYNKITNINNNCKINEIDDCDINKTMKTEVQRYIYLFLLEFIKLCLSNKETNTNKINI